MLSPLAKTGIRYRPYLRNTNVQWGHFDLSDVAEMDSTKTRRRSSLFAPEICSCAKVGNQVGPRYGRARSTLASTKRLFIVSVRSVMT
jgi:hypothetical protein